MLVYACNSLVMLKKLNEQVCPAVFYPSAIISIFVVVFSVAFTDLASSAISWLNINLVSQLGWFYIISMSVFFIAILYILFTTKGSIRLGAPDSKPEFSTITWFTMLFSAGMGIGLLFYGVAEPVMHYTSPAPPISSDLAGSILAAHNAMGLTFFHWGFHPWACYTLVGLALAYFAYCKGFPLSIRSILYPVFGDKIYGPIGHIIDTVAVISTIFGVATSLGLGAMQINAGLNFVFGISESTNIQVVVILLITLIAIVSVVSGVNKGIRYLSEFNIGLATILLISILLLGPTVFLLNSFVENIGIYLQKLPQNSFWTAAHNPDRQSWLSGWTVFYWAWWIAWSPFVGMFLARISKGRTIREFILGVLFVPVLMTLFWFTIFGGSAIYFEANGILNMQEAISNSVPGALFYFFEAFPISDILKIIALICIVLFFVTSSDSASLVIDIISSGGKVKLNNKLKVFWASLEGLIAAALLIAGDLLAIQTASITAAFAFTIILWLACYGLIKTLRKAS